MISYNINQFMVSEYDVMLCKFLIYYIIADSYHMMRKFYDHLRFFRKMRKMKKEQTFGGFQY